MKRFLAVWIITTTGLLSVLACRNPAQIDAVHEEIDSGAIPDTGTSISVSLSRLSPVFSDLFTTSTGTAGSVSSSRAIIGASRAEFRLYTDADPATPVESWSWNVYYQNDGSGWDSLWTDYHPLSVSGTGYTLETDVFNDAVSTTVPVVSGSKTGVEIIEGQRTPVSIRCLPVSPIPTLNSVTTRVDLQPVLIPFVVVGTSLTELGQEAWYRLDLSSGQLTLICSLDPENSATVAAVLYDQYGAIKTPVKFSATASQPFSNTFTLVAGTYYLGVAQSRPFGAGTDHGLTLTLIDGPTP